MTAAGLGWAVPTTAGLGVSVGGGAVGLAGGKAVVGDLASSPGGVGWGRPRAGAGLGIGVVGASAPVVASALTPSDDALAGVGETRAGGLAGDELAAWQPARATSNTSNRKRRIGANPAGFIDQGLLA